MRLKCFRSFNLGKELNICLYFIIFLDLDLVYFLFLVLDLTEISICVPVDRAIQLKGRRLGGHWGVLWPIKLYPLMD